MKLITRDTDYAIRAMCCIAKQKEKKVAVAQLVKNLKMPRPFLRKILQILNKKGLLHSYKGKGGGFELTKPAEKITIFDLVNIFQGPLEITKCTFKKKACPSVRICLLRKKIDIIEKYVIRSLKSITIASLIR